MELNTIEIQNRIPHRYPFLFVDKIVELEPGKRAKGVKNITFNEPFFQGHFPGNPIMPGVIMVEALAQVAGVCCMELEENRGKLGVFVGIDNCKFRRQVVPGDVLTLEIEMVSLRRGIGKAEVKAKVEEELACSGTLTFALIDQKQ